MGRVVRGGRPSPFSDGGREESPDTTRQQALRKWGTWEAKAPADGKCRRKNTARDGFGRFG